LKPTIGQESLFQDCGDNEVRLVIIATSQILVVRSTVFPHRNNHKYIWPTPDGKTHNQIDHVLIDRRWHLSVRDVRSYWVADCNSDRYLLFVKFRESLAVSTQATQRFDRQRFNRSKLNQLAVRKQYHIEITNSFQALENLKDYEDLNRTWENNKDNIQTSAEESLALHELKQHKTWFDEECYFGSKEAG